MLGIFPDEGKDSSFGDHRKRKGSNSRQVARYYLYFSLFLGYGKTVEALVN